MTTWVYVQALNHPKHNDVSFRHCLVQAESDGDAYAEGGRQMDAMPLNGLELLNDYVVEIPA